MLGYKNSGMKLKKMSVKSDNLNCQILVWHIAKKDKTKADYQVRSGTKKIINKKNGAAGDIIYINLSIRIMAFFVKSDDLIDIKEDKSLMPVNGTVPQFIVIGFIIDQIQ